jgi:hypothetical protein
MKLAIDTRAQMLILGNGVEQLELRQGYSAIATDERDK